MARIWIMARKDLRLLFRDKVGLFWAFGFPVMMALFFGALFGGSGGGASGIQVGIADLDQSADSVRFVELLQQSPSLRVEMLAPDEAHNQVRRGKLAAYIVVKKGFGDATGFFGGAGVEIGIDPARRAEEGFLQGVLMQAAVRQMVDRFTDPDRMKKQIGAAQAAVQLSPSLNAKQKELLGHLLGSVDQWVRDGNVKGLANDTDFSPLKLEVKSVALETTRPKTAFDITFPQGVMWGILGTINSFAVGLVVERRSGTLLRLRVAPMPFGELLAGKALGCFMTCMVIVTVILIFGRLLFGVHFDQPFLLVLALVSCGICYTGIMMLLSTLGKTERAVGGVGWGVLMPLTMIGGGTIPLFFMPGWLQSISNISPIKWSLLGMEGAMWRGFSLGEMLLPCGIQIGVGVVCFAAGVWMMKRQEL